MKIIQTKAKYNEYLLPPTSLLINAQMKNKEAPRNAGIILIDN